MKQKLFTPVPNIILDKYIGILSLSELRVLFVILRQTLGFINKYTKQRKSIDWISNMFFVRKTHLSSKSVSLAIAGLIDKKLIVALDIQGNALPNPKDRKAKKRIYYAYAPYWEDYIREKAAKELQQKFTNSL